MLLLFTIVLIVVTDYSVSLLLCGEAPNYKRYDENEKMCCNGTIHKRKTHLCCGNIVINKTNSNTGSCNETLEKKTTNIVKPENNASYSGGLTTTYGNIWLCGVSNESRQYNDAKETCCNGTIYNKTGFCCKGEFNPETPSWQCCGSIMINLDVSGCCGAGNPYDKTKKQCCGGKVSNLKDKCCAGKVIDTKTQVCCSSNPLTNETIIQKKRTNHDKCCPSLNGGKSYDSFHFECRWKSKIVPVCPKECRPNGMILIENFCKNRNNDAPLISNFEKVPSVMNKLDRTSLCNGKNYERTFRTNSLNNCCKGMNEKLFNPDTHICCGGSLYPRIANGTVQDCCKSTIYNSRKTLCCGGIHYPKYSPDSNACCGSTIYSFKDEMCCGYKVHKLNFTRLCCGNETFDAFLQQCYQDTEVMNVFESKCGDTKYDTRKQMCCNQVLTAGNHRGLRCCGSVTFNYSLNDCVENKVVTKGYLLCQNQGEYNPLTHDCCEGEIKRRNGSWWRCCGSNVINYEVENCCAGKGYHKRNEQCCGGIVTKIEDACCAGQILDPHTQVCCGKTLFTNEEIIQKNNTKDDKCCVTVDGQISYNSTNFVCSWERNIVSRKNNRTLCGRREFNPKEDLCCNSRIFKKALQRGMKCCMPSASIYNSRTHTCCYGIKKAGKRCWKARFRRRCPRRCGRRKITIKKYCKMPRGTYLQRPISRLESKMKRQLKLIERGASCKCVYKRKIKKDSCVLNGNRCMSYREITGILVVKKRRITLWYFQRKRKQGDQTRFCASNL